MADAVEVPAGSIDFDPGMTKHDVSSGLTEVDVAAFDGEMVGEFVIREQFVTGIAGVKIKARLESSSILT